MHASAVNLDLTGIDQMGKILIVMSIILVAYGTWHIRTLGFANA